jgi:hypothetical protein
MNTPKSKHARPVLLAAILGAAVTLACGEDGVTPNCPELPLYDARDPATLNDPEIQAALERAERQNCATPRAEEETGAAGAP